MDHGPEITLQLNLKAHDVYTPFRWERDNVIRWVVAGLLCLIFRDLYASSRETLQGFPGAGSITAIMIILVVFILLAILLFPYLRVRALFRSSRLAETTRITFRPDKILFQSENGQSECKWTIFDRVFETRRVFAFSQGRIGATYVPKRCFTDPNDIQLLRQMIRENFKGKRTLRRD